MTEEITADDYRYNISEQEQLQAAKHAPSLTLTLKQSKYILLTNRSFYVTDNGPGCIIHKFYTNLCYSSTGSSSSQDLFTS